VEFLGLGTLGSLEWLEAFPRGKGLEARRSKLLDEDRRESFLAETEILQLAATGFAWQVRGETFKVTRSYTE